MAKWKSQHHKNTIIHPRLFPALSHSICLRLKVQNKSSFSQVPSQRLLLSLSDSFHHTLRERGQQASTHLTSRGNLNISCSLFLFCLLAFSLFCPHLCVYICQYISLPPDLSLSYNPSVCVFYELISI